jgi:hypothetical protein
MSALSKVQMSVSDPFWGFGGCHFDERGVDEQARTEPSRCSGTAGWGQDLLYLYNDPYKSIIGGKHPCALGRPAREVWREIWPDIGPMLATAMGGDEGTYVEAQLLIMERSGYPEETYYTFSYSPIPDDQGRPGWHHLRQYGRHAARDRGAPTGFTA